MPSVHPDVTNDRPGLEWRPDEFGLRRALLLACLPVAAGAAALVLLLAKPAAPPPAAPIAVQLVNAPPLPPMVAATLPSDPAPVPMPPPAAAAPEPTPDLAHPEPPPSLLAAPAPSVPEPAPAPEAGTIPLPPEPPAAPAAARPDPRPPMPQRPLVRHRPVRHVQPAVPDTADDAPAVAAPSPVPVQAQPRPAPPPALPRDTTSGLGAYRAELHAQIARNMFSDEEVRRLGVTGVAVIEAVIAPDGSVLDARVSRSSGIRGIDRAALSAVRRGGYRPFGPRMPAEPITVSVPITVSGD